MIRWVIGLFIAALVAAFLGFGGVAGAFAAMAQVLFFVLLILFAVSAVIAMAGARSPAVHGTIRMASLVVLVAAVSIGAYAWIENGMSAERAGRAIDREAAAMSQAAGEVFNDARDRTQSFVSNSVQEARAAGESQRDANDGRETSQE